MRIKQKISVFFITFALFLVPLLSSAATPSFAPRVDYHTGAKPGNVAFADFNGDGTLDMAVTNPGSDTVSVFLNNGNGTFAPKFDRATGAGPSAVALGDLNGDGKTDMVVANQASQSFSIFLGNGNGTFAPKVDYGNIYDPLYGDTDAPEGIALGDLNGDGKLDIVTTSFSQNFISVFLNNGNGTFAFKSSYDLGFCTIFGAAGVALGDINGDGKLDVVADVFDCNRVYTFFNQGGGTLGQTHNYGVGNPYGIALGDLNGDGKLDMVVGVEVGINVAGVSIFLNNGNGTFAPRVDYTAGPRSFSSVAIGDVNNDGKADIVTTEQNWGPSTVSIFLNNGNGTFAPKIDSPVGSNFGGLGTTNKVALGDLNGDGKRDMAVTNPGSDTVSVFLNTTVLSSGTVNVTSNISSSWTITGPATIIGSGTFQANTGEPLGMYTITWNPVVGYTTPPNELLWLTAGNQITFLGNYVAVKPDLTVSAAPTITGTLTDGQMLTFTGTMKNIGSAKADGPFNAKFQLDKDKDGSYETTLQVTNAVASGSNIPATTGTKLVTSPNWTATAGTYNVRLCADLPPDPNGNVDEGSNEGNNCGPDFAFVISSPSTLATPTISPATATYDNDISVTMSGPIGATIRYTTDGSTPTATSPIYSGAIPVSITGMIVKAKAFQSGYTDSATASETYTLTTATPTISASSGTYSPSVSTTIGSITSGATIRYTTDGSTPTATSPIYSSMLTFTNSTTLKAKAFKANYNDSAVATAVYTITLPQCSDGIDNDGDGKVDYPADPGCTSASDTTESPDPALTACSDGIDNDNDGLVDFIAPLGKTKDPGCSSATDNNEFNLKSIRPS